MECEVCVFITVAYRAYTQTHRQTDRQKSKKTEGAKILSNDISTFRIWSLAVQQNKREWEVVWIGRQLLKRNPRLRARVMKRKLKIELKRPVQPVISTYINTKMCVCVSVCLCVCLFAFFSAIWNPIGIPFGTKLPFRLEKVLTQ